MSVINKERPITIPHSLKLEFFFINKKIGFFPDSGKVVNQFHQN